MRVDEQKIRYAIACIFVLAGLWAMLVRGNAWPFAIEDLGLAPHKALIAEMRLETELEQEILNGGAIDQLARDVILKDPLAVYPFEALLSAEVDRERLVPGSLNTAVADKYAAATLDRDGRNLTARFYLLDKAIIAGDWDEVLDQFGGAYELWPEQREELLFGLEQMLADPQMVEALIRASRNQATWVPAFLRQTSIDALQPDDLERLYQPQPDAHQRLLEQFVRTGRVEQAYQFWVSLQPDEASKFDYGLVDPSFEGSRLLVPFNWQIDDKFAELLSRQEALQIFYRGRGRAVFASQITRLTPGSYVFRIGLDALPNETGGDFVWQIACLNSGDALLEISVFDYAKLEESAGVPFLVPENCSFQDLSIRGYPGQFTRSVTLQINEIEILRTERLP